MSQPDYDALDALVAEARRAQPPALTPLEERRQVRLAVSAAERRTQTRLRRLAWLCAACVVLAVSAVATTRLTTKGTSIEVAAGDRPLRVALTSGDTVVAAPGAELSVLAQERAARALRLVTGTALFDVLPLRENEAFEVHTQHAHVRVLGTVFSVEVAGGRTVVRVYEGRVWVNDRSLPAGQVWVSNGDMPTFPGDALASEARAAAAQRAHAPTHIVSTLPDVEATPPIHGAGVDAAVSVWVVTPAALPDVVPVSLEQARGWLLAGDSEHALREALSPAHAEQEDWQLLAADALRALRRYEEAVVSYRRLAERAADDTVLRASAGYAGGSLALYELHDAASALSLLDALALDAASSPLRERASVLRVDVLLALGRTAEAKQAAQRYLEREPDTQVSRRMRALLR